MRRSLSAQQERTEWVIIAEMDVFGHAGHVIAMVTLVIAALVIVPLARLLPQSVVTGLCVLLGAFLIVNAIVYQGVVAAGGAWSVSASLPLYLCDIAEFVVGAALIWPSPQLVEISWFWAIAGATQAVITPNQDVSFPSYGWLEFYGGHLGVIIGALVLVVARGVHPRPGAVRRVYTITAAYMAATGIIDAVTGGNYNFLRSPAEGSLLTVFGPWPVYIVAAAALALIIFVILDLPFWPERRRRRRTQAGTTGGPEPLRAREG